MKQNTKPKIFAIIASLSWVITSALGLPVFSGHLPFSFFEIFMMLFLISVVISALSDDRILRDVTAVLVIAGILMAIIVPLNTREVTAVLSVVATGIILSLFAALLARSLWILTYKLRDK